MRFALRSFLLCLPSIVFLGCGSDSSTGSVSPFSSDSSVYTDARDGQSYRTIRIGSQRWMARSLNYKVDSSFCYVDAADSCAKYGRLYPWQVAMAIDTSYAHKIWLGDTLRDTLHHQGVCPAGWRMPSAGDWKKLVQTAGNSHDDSAAIRLKAATVWSTPGIDAYGFGALPSGQRGADKIFQQLGGFFDIWTTAESGASQARNAYLQNANTTTLGASSKAQAFSVRCLLD
jgi:uncharacterized protein (TIGR02145 family)